MSGVARISGAEVNADLLELVTVRADALPWAPTGTPGVTAKVLERIASGPDARETAILRLEPGAVLAPEVVQCRVDLFVLEGTLEVGGEARSARYFARFAPGREIGLRSAGGAAVMIKKRAGAGGADIEIDTADRANWAAWGGRGSEKAQIYDPGELAEASWVGFMLPDLTIPEHAHSGGEEIFILEGELRDERGLYGPGTWVRFPVGVTHTPTSLSQGCLMLVREGDARPTA